MTAAGRSRRVKTADRMVHRIRRLRDERLEEVLRRARLAHGEIGGVDAEAYLEMSRGVFAATFSFYPGLIADILRILGRPDGTVLDAGCGPGVLEEILLASGQASVVAVDGSEDMLAIVRRTLEPWIRQGRLTVLKQNLEARDASLPCAPVDCVVVKHTAHHINDLPNFFRLVRAACRQRCAVVIHDHLRDGDLRTAVPFIEGLLRLPGDHFGICTRILAYVDSRRVAYAPDEVTDALEAAGFRCGDVMLSADEFATIGTLTPDDDCWRNMQCAFRAVLASAGFRLA